MNITSYNIVMAGLNQSVEVGISSEIAANKSAVVGLFPSLWAWLVRTVLWAGLLKIGSVIGKALVGIILRRLGEMTLADLAGLIATFMQSQGKTAHPSVVACSQGRVAVIEPAKPALFRSVIGDDDGTI